MIILEDTRQQTHKHDLKHKWFEEHGITVERCRLYVGDYTLPTDQRICIDTKSHLLEIASNVTQDHERVRNELIRAQNAGIKLIFLIEHGEGIESLEDVIFWENPRLHKVKRINGKWIEYTTKATTGETLYNILRTITRKYGVEFRFCRKEETGRKIVEILTEGVV